MKTSTTILLCAAAAGVVVLCVVQARKRAAAPAQSTNTGAAALGGALAGFVKAWGADETKPPPGASSGTTGGIPHGTESTGDGWWNENYTRMSAYDGGAPTTTFKSYAEQSIAGSNEVSLYSVAPTRAARA